MEDRPLETPPMVGRGGEAVRFNWSHSVPVAAGNRAWGALARALATTQEEDSDVYFTVRDADTGGSVGEAYVNLERLLKGGVDKVSEAVQVLDAKDRLVGRLTLTVRALDALRTVQAEGLARARGCGERGGRNVGPSKSRRRAGGAAHTSASRTSAFS